MPRLMPFLTRLRRGHQYFRLVEFYNFLRLDTEAGHAGHSHFLLHPFAGTTLQLEIPAPPGFSSVLGLLDWVTIDRQEFLNSLEILFDVNDIEHVDDVVVLSWVDDHSLIKLIRIHEVYSFEEELRRGEGPQWVDDDRELSPMPDLTLDEGDW
jgi:hypothetical protein